MNRKVEIKEFEDEQDEDNYNDISSFKSESSSGLSAGNENYEKYPFDKSEENPMNYKAISNISENIKK